MACSFIAELSKLRKLSVESVENTTSFDEFKRYLHVLRPVEAELRDLLVKINGANRKTLVLLCGSAGDGKSHLMSYLRNADQDHLLDSFEIYLSDHLGLIVQAQNTRCLPKRCRFILRHLAVHLRGSQLKTQTIISPTCSKSVF